jgi:DnaJ-domain-containing protein 1
MNNRKSLRKLSKSNKCYKDLMKQIDNLIVLLNLAELSMKHNQICQDLRSRFWVNRTPMLLKV